MQDDTDSGIESSFTDLMTSLAVIFILLLCATMNNAFEESQSTRTKVLERLQQQLNEFVEQGVKVETVPKDPLALLILVPEGLLEFQKGQSTIPPRGIEFLHRFIPRLTDTIYQQEFRDDIGSVVVEGHTSSEGPNALNLELSQNRSMAVVGKSLKIIESSNGSSNNDRAKMDHFLRVLSASGRGKQDPIMMADGTEDHQQSRRVIFKIRVKSFEEKIEKKLSND
jgi:outer membrane protein OmpA-like peptidoglycan-associated protein